MGRVKKNPSKAAASGNDSDARNLVRHFALSARCPPPLPCALPAPFTHVRACHTRARSATCDSTAAVGARARRRSTSPSWILRRSSPSSATTASRRARRPQRASWHRQSPSTLQLKTLTRYEPPPPPPPRIEGIPARERSGETDGVYAFEFTFPHSPLPSPREIPSRSLSFRTKRAKCNTSGGIICSRGSESLTGRGSASASRH